MSWSCMPDWPVCIRKFRGDYSCHAHKWYVLPATQEPVLELSCKALLAFQFPLESTNFRRRVQQRGYALRDNTVESDYQIDPKALTFPSQNTVSFTYSIPSKSVDNTGSLRCGTPRLLRNDLDHNACEILSIRMNIENDHSVKMCVISTLVQKTQWVHSQNPMAFKRSAVRFCKQQQILYA